jgi:hypothetical protein
MILLAMVKSIHQSQVLIGCYARQHSRRYVHQSNYWGTKGGQSMYLLYLKWKNKLDTGEMVFRFRDQSNESTLTTDELHRQMKEMADRNTTLPDSSLIFCFMNK